ncbi:hypothetical protein [Clostridium rectalis]|uniref:hypothetical protein n=1 Tax=Clostridium rectalis TaxID=2040295 RepID=UPI000F644ED1|nr:hypothetical protein [Clostridium rectalis]
MQNKKFWAYLFSLMPGAGHMYLGLQKKGLQIMLSFVFLITICDWVHIPLIGMLIPVIWFYSIFDVRKVLHLGSFPDESLNFTIPYNGNSNKLIAYIFIAIGVIALIKNFIFPMLDIYLDFRIERYIKTIIGSLIFIGIGIKLLMGNKKLLLPGKKEDID